MHTFFNRLNIILILIATLLTSTVYAQQRLTPNWIRPDDVHSPPIWGLHNGIVVGLWPASVEKAGQNAEGGPRGLLRIGYEYLGTVYLINFIAAESVVNGDMEFSEVSPSVVDGKWGKFFWAADSTDNDKFTPYANTRGDMTHPDAKHPDVEELSLYVHMEKYLSAPLRGDRRESGEV